MNLPVKIEIVWVFFQFQVASFGNRFPVYEPMTVRNFNPLFQVIFAVSIISAVTMKPLEEF